MFTKASPLSRHSPLGTSDLPTSIAGSIFPSQSHVFPLVSSSPDRLPLTPKRRVEESESISLDEEAPEEEEEKKEEAERERKKLKKEKKEKKSKRERVLRASPAGPSPRIVIGRSTEPPRPKSLRAVEEALEALGFSMDAAKRDVGNGEMLCELRGVSRGSTLPLTCKIMMADSEGERRVHVQHVLSRLQQLGVTPCFPGLLREYRSLGALTDPTHDCEYSYSVLESAHSFLLDARGLPVSEWRALMFQLIWTLMVSKAVEYRHHELHPRHIGIREGQFDSVYHVSSSLHFRIPKRMPLLLLESSSRSTVNEDYNNAEDICSFLEKIGTKMVDWDKDSRREWSRVRRFLKKRGVDRRVFEEEFFRPLRCDGTVEGARLFRCFSEVSRANEEPPDFRISIKGAPKELMGRTPTKPLAKLPKRARKMPAHHVAGVKRMPSRTSSSSSSSSGGGGARGDGDNFFHDLEEAHSEEGAVEVTAFLASFGLQQYAKLLVSTGWDTMETIKLISMEFLSLPVYDEILPGHKARIISEAHKTQPFFTL